MRTCALIFCISTVLVLIHSASTEVRTVVKTVHAECQADPASHIDEDIIKKFHNGEDVDKAVIGAHMICMTKKLGLIDEDGKINKVKLRRGLARGISEEAKVDEALEKCSEDKGSLQENALAVDKCLWEHVGSKSSEHHHHH